MNKTLSIHLNGKLFHIEEEGYRLLLQFFDQLPETQTESKAGKIIQRNIEELLAECFEHFNSQKQVVLAGEVQLALELLLQNQQSAELELDIQRHELDKIFKRKKLKRDPQKGMAGGVCAGIAAYLGINPIWVRMAFAIGLFFYLSAVPVYLICWRFIPTTKTLLDKLRLTGTFVSIEKLRMQWKESGAPSKMNIQPSENKQLTGNVFNDVFEWLIEKLTQLFRFTGRFIGYFLLGFGLMLLTIVLSIYAGLLPGWIKPLLLHGDKLRVLMNYLFANKWQTELLMAALLVVCIVPTLAFILGGLRLLINPKKPLKYLGSINGALLLLGLMALLISSFLLILEFRKKAIISYEEAIIARGDTLTIELHRNYYHTLLQELQVAEWSMLPNNNFVNLAAPVKIKFSEAKDKPIFFVHRTSAGKSRKEAFQFANEIKYYHHWRNNTIRINAYMLAKNTSKLRAQRLEYEFGLRKGQYVRLTTNAKLPVKIVVGNEWKSVNEYNGKLLKFENNTLICLQCK